MVKIQGTLANTEPLEPLTGVITEEGGMIGVLSASSTTLPYYEADNEYGTTVFIGDERFGRQVERMDQNGV